MPSVKITKTAIRKIEVETRARMREKLKDSEFMRKSLSIYNGQVKRALEVMSIVAAPVLPYTIEQFRDWMRPLVNTLCSCGKKMTLKQIHIDHCTPISRGGSWFIYNLQALCKSCNWRKGILLPEEYGLLVCLLDSFTPDSREDVYRRLTIGGKWSFKKQ